MRTVRLSPSGPDLLNTDGGPFAPGPGARLRMDDNSWTIGDGSEIVPTTATVVTTNGFSGGSPVTVHLANPNPDLRYGFEVETDIINTSTSIDLTVQFFLEVSRDAGATWTEVASNEHHPAAAADLTTDVNSGRQIAIHKRLTLGSDLGVVAGDADLLVRVKMAQPGYTGGAGAMVASPYTTGASTNSVGTFYMRVEECF